MKRKWWVLIIVVIMFIVGGGIAWYLIYANEENSGVECDLESCFELQRRGHEIICSCPWS